jgi:hypothetical protein
VTAARIERLLVLASCVGLAALVLMVWSVFDPRPMPVMVAMSIGQALGTASLGLYVVAVALDLRRARVLDRAARASEPPPEAPP